MTKFVRCSEYRPAFSEAVLEAIGHYRQIYALRNEAQQAVRVAGLSVSANMLQLRLAKLIEAAELTGRQELLLTDLSEKLYDIKRRFPDPAEQKQAIAKLVFDGHYMEFIMEQLYSYIPKLEKMLASGVNGMSPVSRSDAEDIASTAFQNFIQNKDSASIVSSLERFDPSEGSLLNWIQGGLKAATQKLVAERQRLQNQEMSMNQKIGDNDDTEMGDMLAGDNGEPDLSTYSERADQLITTLANYARDLQRQIAREENAGEKFKLEMRLQHIQNPENEVSTKLQRLKQIGDGIEDYDYDVTQAEADINDLMNALSRAKNPDPNVLEGAKARRKALLQKLQKAKDIRQNAINEFENIYADLRDLEQYNVETGKTLVNNEPTQAPISPDAVTPDAVAPDAMPPSAVAPEMPAAMPAETPEVQVRTKARGNRSLLSPQDEKIIQKRLEDIRNKVHPSIFKSMGFPQSQKEFYDANNQGLFTIKEVRENLTSRKDLDALRSGDLSQASDDAIYASIFMKGMLYARDQQAIDKAYDPELVRSDAEILRRATDKFLNYMENEIQNNEILQQREQAFVPTAENPTPPIERLLNKLREYIHGVVSDDVSKKKVETTDNRFRTLFEHFDRMVRGATYNRIKDELFGNKSWQEITPEQMQQIASQAYEEQYYAGQRPMYIGRADAHKKHKARYPSALDLEGSKYQGWMNQEMSNIQQGNDDWYYVSGNDEDFKNRSKKSPKEPIDISACFINSLVRLASIFDSRGNYCTADAITADIKAFTHGQNIRI